jgi:predicted Zn-ribbon and HTH transcriptional regulator
VSRPHRGVPESGPPERNETVPQALGRLLRNGTWSLRELSRELGLREHDVAPHLEKLARSVVHEGQTLEVTPPSCLACGFSFEGRRRASRPSRCPECKSERLSPARYAIVTA